MVQQTQTWCKVCGNGDHSADVSQRIQNKLTLWVMLKTKVIKILGTHIIQDGNHPNISWGGNQGQNTNQ